MIRRKLTETAREKSTRPDYAVRAGRTRGLSRRPRLTAAALHVANIEGMRREVRTVGSPGLQCSARLFGCPAPVPSLKVIGGDAAAECIAAASVLAKVSRGPADGAMGPNHPGTGFAVQQGYRRGALGGAQRAGTPARKNRHFIINVRRGVRAGYPDSGGSAHRVRRINWVGKRWSTPINARTERTAELMSAEDLEKSMKTEMSSRCTRNTRTCGAVQLRGGNRGGVLSGQTVSRWFPRTTPTARLLRARRRRVGVGNVPAGPVRQAGGVSPSKMSNIER